MKTITHFFLSGLFAYSLLGLTSGGVRGVEAAGGDEIDGAAARAAEAVPATKPTAFRVRIENISGAEGQLASDGSRWPFALSPGLYVVHTKKAPLFKPGKNDAGQGLEAQAEDGNPEALLESLDGEKGVRARGVFNTPVGASAPGPIGPGAAFEFTFTAEPGDRLSFAAMFGQSNDLFYAPDEGGIALFEDGEPVHGEITRPIILWDAGTEVNQEPGIGSDQAPRQQAANTGAAESARVGPVAVRFAYPETTAVLRITITPTPQGSL